MVDQVTRRDHDVGLRRQAIDMHDRLCHLRVGGNLPVTEAVSCHDVKVGYLRDDHFVWRAPEPRAYDGRRLLFPLSNRRPYDPAASSRVADPEEVSAAGSDVERALVGIAESAVGRCVYANRHRVSLQDAPLGVPDVDHRARTAGVGARGGHDISLAVEAHAVDASLGASIIFAELMQNDVAAQRTIRQDVVGPELAAFRTGLDHVKSALVRRDQKAVGPGRISGHSSAHPGTVRLRIGSEYRVMVERLPLARIDIAGVPWIAEPDASLTVDLHVVRGVKAYAVQPINDGRCAALLLEPHNRSST